MSKKHLINDEFASSCYFRSSIEKPYRKALIKITDWCNLHCAHCFVSAGQHGDTMSYSDIETKLLPSLIESRVISVTLTGGEPFAHESIIEIVRLFRKSNIRVSICTNATMSDEEQIKTLAEIGGVSVNVSLDGFSTESHGKFRGDKKSFYKTYETIKIFSKYNILKGFLTTPNSLTSINEYKELCEFAIENNAQYVLMNPLSLFGRGIKSKNKLASTDDIMNKIKETTLSYDKDIEIVNIRFPNKSLPLASCEAGNIIYVFVNGDVTVCPYLIFATENANSQHKAEEFIIGNIFANDNISKALDNYNIYERYNIGDNNTCISCSLGSTCKKGCPAAIIASGQKMEGIDLEQCPKYS